MNILIGSVQLLEFILVDTNGDIVPGLGNAFTVLISKNGGAFAQGTGTKAEISNGWYSYELTQTETNTAGPLAIDIAGVGAIQRLLHQIVGYLSTPHILITVFATVQDIEAFLQIEITTPAQVLSAQRALTEASAAIRNYTRQYLEQVDDEVITLDSLGGSRLFLPELPVLEITKVIEDGVTLTQGVDYKLGQHGILHRTGQRWSTGIQNITITYSHGFADIPDDIVAICTRAASRAYQAGVRSADSDGLMGVASKSLGDFSVAFASESGGGVGEGIMGASAARMLLMSEKDVLDKYRIKP